MSSYNLIKNGVMTAVTLSGTGNKSLTGSELYKLVDGNTTSSGIPLISSDVLYLDVDLGYRIKVNSLQLYANDLTKQANITFSYKNYESDLYTVCAESVSPVSYVATVPDPSAPRYLRCTVSGIDIDLYEFKVLNDDFIIEFGADGSELDVWLDDTPIGIEGTPRAIEIYNNSSGDKATSAYVCIDYTGNDKDDYIKISNTQNGIYEGFEDGAILGYKYHDWDTGSYSNTYKETDNTIRMTSTGYNYIRDHKIGYLPVQISYTGFGNPFGYKDATDYDSINNKIYTMFWDGTSGTVGTLKLYEYDVDANTWTYLSSFNQSSPSAPYICMCYHLGYIYFMMHASGVFYRHNLSGAQDNIETLSTMSGYSYYYRNLIAVDSDTIYYFSTNNSDSPAYQSFQVYTISTDVWLSKAVPDFQNSTTRRASLVYDSTRSVMYKFNTSSLNGWVQRYNISGDTWDENYFNFSSRISASPGDIGMYYYNDKIYFCGSSLTYVYTYDVVTDIVTSIDVDLTLNAFHSYVIVTPPTVNATASGINDVSMFITPIVGDLLSLYGYNTGVEYTEQLSDFKTGTYTSAIITVSDSYKSSYFIVDGDTEATKSSISTDDTLYNGTIEVRSSDIKPISINEVYWPYYYFTSLNGWNYATWIGRYVVGTDTFNVDWKRTQDNDFNIFNILPAAINRRNGNIFSGYHSTTGNQVLLKLYDRSGTEIESDVITDTADMYTYKQPYFDGSHGVWVFIERVSTLYHRDFVLSSLGSKSIPSLYQLAADLNGDGCWYTERSNMTLAKVFSDCTVDFTINIESPYGVCSTEDNGCWVSDIADLTNGYVVKRYDSQGTLVNTVILDKPVYNLSHDHNDGFYAITSVNDGEVRHYTSTGTLDMKVSGIVGFDYISGGVDGCVVYSKSLKKTHYIDKDTASILWTKDYTQDIFTSGSSYSNVPAIFSFDLNLQDKYEDDSGKLLPVSYDTLWYGNTNLDWQEVPKDGYFLPKQKFHQIRTTLKSLDGTSTPIMRSIAMAPAVKVTDIYPQTSKPVYVRSDIPVNSSVSKFDTRIKVWWDVEE